MIAKGKLLAKAGGRVIFHQERAVSVARLTVVGCGIAAQRTRFFHSFILTCIDHIVSGRTPRETVGWDGGISHCFGSGDRIYRYHVKALGSFDRVIQSAAFRHPFHGPIQIGIDYLSGLEVGEGGICPPSVS